MDTIAVSCGMYGLNGALLRDEMGGLYAIIGRAGALYCTPHQIREFILEQIVQDDLRRVTLFARMKQRQFAEYINRKNSTELSREITKLQKELDAMKRRDNELSKLFQRIYEDNVLVTITNEQFRMLSTGYNTEQKALKNAIPEKEAQLEKLRASAANVEAFIEKAKRYTSIDRLTPELLRLFIQRIEIGERTKKHAKKADQSIRIVYRDIGAVDSMMQEGEVRPYIKPPVILTGEITIDGVPVSFPA